LVGSGEKGDKRKMKLTCPKVMFCLVVICIFSGLAYGEPEREPNQLEWCYYDAALQTASPEPCYKISPQAVYSAGFSPSGYQIVYWRSQCFMDVAQLAGNKNLCDEVKTISTFSLKGDKISKEECIASVARHAKPISNAADCHCEQILKTMGYDKNNIPQAFIKNGYIDYMRFYLENVNTDDFKGRFKLLPDFSKNGEPDGSVSVEEGAQYSQERQIAVSNKDPEICRKMPDFLERARCYHEVAAAGNNPSLCAEIKENGNLEYYCYMNCAVVNNDIKICDRLDEGSNRTECRNTFYMYSAVQKNDFSICDASQDANIPGSKDRCYKEFAVETNNESVCDKIQSRNSKWICHRECKTARANQGGKAVKKDSNKWNIITVY
jgi:hypothetical protein